MDSYCNLRPTSDFFHVLMVVEVMVFQLWKFGLGVLGKRSLGIEIGGIVCYECECGVLLCMRRFYREFDVWFYHCSDNDSCVCLFDSVGIGASRNF